MLDGVVGTAGCLGVLGEGDAVFVADGDRLGETCCTDVSRLTASVLDVEMGGGKGDIDTAVIDAEWAW